MLFNVQNRNVIRKEINDCFSFVCLHGVPVSYEININMPVSELDLTFKGEVPFLPGYLPTKVFQNISVKGQFHIYLGQSNKQQVSSYGLSRWIVCCYRFQRYLKARQVCIDVYFLGGKFKPSDELSSTTIKLETTHKNSKLGNRILKEGEV